MSMPGKNGAAAALRDDARAIWSAAIAAVTPESLVARRLAVVNPGRELCFDGRPLDPPVRLEGIGRIAVVGAGKAAAGMAAGLVRLLGDGPLVSGPPERHRLSGLVGVPEGAGGQLPSIAVRETRPAKHNLPTAAAVAATREMLGMVSALGPDDLAIAVVTGGGSALLVAPREGVPLDEKIAVAGFLSRAGADIRELNTVRQAASIVKAGGLARACTAGRLVVLVLSDVIGDPLDVISSGPCMPIEPRPAEALAILAKYGATTAGICPRLAGMLAADQAVAPAGTRRADGSWTTPRGCRVSHLLLGTNDTAVAAAAAAAAERGYAVQRGCGVERAEPPSPGGGAAEETGDRLAAAALAALAAADARPRAIIEGGEATVTVPPDHGAGGRNQQTVLAAIESMRRRAASWPEGLLVASVGTDGEDGPTDAAGAFADARVVAAIGDRRLDASRALARCDAYPVFAAAGGLILTGPTGTNVADVRLVLARP